jgi:hypothetical protein
VGKARKEVEEDKAPLISSISSSVRVACAPPTPESLGRAAKLLLPLARISKRHQLRGLPRAGSSPQATTYNHESVEGSHSPSARSAQGFAGSPSETFAWNPISYFELAHQLILGFSRPVLSNEQYQGPPGNALVAPAAPQRPAERLLQRCRVRCDPSRVHRPSLLENFWRAALTWEGGRLVRAGWRRCFCLWLPITRLWPSKKIVQKEIPL